MGFPERSVCCVRFAGREGLFFPKPATSVGLGEVATCFASGGGRRVGAQGLIGWIERGAYKTFFLSCFLFLWPGVAPLLALLRVIISHTFPAGFAAFLRPRWRARDSRRANRRLLQGICNQDPKTSAEATWLHI